MKLGFVGLGKMGCNMFERLLRGGHTCIVTNRSQDSIDIAVSKGAIGAKDLADVVSKLDGPKIVWLMIPAGAPVDEHIAKLKTMLKPGDVIVDGGNSNFRDSMRRGEDLKVHGIHFVDSGTSGGVWGLQVGYCLMVGGSEEAFKLLEPALKTLAPENGYMHCGRVR